MGLEDLHHNFLTGTLEGFVKWARASSSWGANFGLACCAIEMMATGAANFDLARFGMEVFRASPRQADVMIVAGRVSQKMAPVLRQVYDQMMEPKWVISMGVCASSGGMFNNYAIVQGVDQIVPVDVYTPGCPPGPETLIHSILTLHQKIRTGELTRRDLRATIRTPIRSRPGMFERLLVRPRGRGDETGEMIRASTAEGSQEMAPRARTTAREMRIEEGQSSLAGGGILLDRMDMDVEIPEEQTMILNLGPSHPSTHGVLRVMLELDGETVLRSKPVVGYLHTGMEKTGEELAYHQGSTNVTRMDYLAPFFNELGFCLSVEKLLGVEIPPRATWIRMLMCELNRLSSHFLWLGTNGADLGFLNMLVYGWREREMVLSFFEKVTGLRMNHEYIRPGGVVADLPDGWRDDILALCEAVPRRMDEYDRLLTRQPVLQKRLQGVGPIDADTAISLGLTGPLLRSTGVAWDLRRDQPYLAYDDVDFDVIVGTNGDCWDRYAIRLNEIRESVKIIRQIADMMPDGDFRAQDKKITPPPRNRIDESMEALIMHFKLYTEGFRVPVGEAYVPIESPRGESGCFIVSDGTSRPYRMHMRAPSFANLQALPHLARGALVADTVAIVSTIDPVLGDVDR